MRIFTLAVISVLFLSRCNTPGKDADILLREQTKSNNTETLPGTTLKEKKSDVDKPALKSLMTGKKGSVVPSNNAAHARPDSARLSMINLLRSSGRIPDLNEPVTREAILHPSENGAFMSMIELSRESYLKINFDNDILNNTDMYYTNGMRLDFIFPFVQSFPVSRLLMPYWGNGTNYYGFSVFQNMYTPSTTKTGGIHEGDRPYASYLCLGLFKITNDPRHRFRQSSELDLGILGPYSFGEFVQKAYHNNTPTNNEPLGWEYQIGTDLVLNYSVSLEKGIIHNPWVELNLLASGNLGTLYTNIEGGFHLRTGLMNPYFANLGTSRKAINLEKGLKKTQVFFFLKSSARLVGYDATLQGGVFNDSNPYTIPSSDISRFMSESSAGISLVFNAFRLDAEQYFLSPEFHGGKWHFWVHTGITVAL